MPLDTRLSSHEKRGFALIMTLVLLGFVLALVVTLVVLIQVESRSSALSIKAVESRQNALLGMRIALSELQVAAGPDNRAVARADTMYRRLGIDRAAIPAVTGDEPENRAYWVGVSNSNPNSSITRSNQQVQWLVSGLNRNQGSEQQLREAFEDPITLVGDNSVGGDASSSTNKDNQLKAGKVDVSTETSTLGSYAWIIDDESQKAKLAPSNRAVTNDAEGDALDDRGTIVPGLFDVSTLTGLSYTNVDSIFSSTKLQDFNVVDSTNIDVVQERFYDYTLTGYGLQVDTQATPPTGNYPNGRLKRDLTAAFENPAIFDNLFTESAQDDIEPPYVTMDEDKFFGEPTIGIRSNGYIHMGIFRDYYSLYEEVEDGTLSTNAFQKALVNNFGGGNDDTRFGSVGPHDFTYISHPYGNIIAAERVGTMPSIMNDEPFFRHNPISPILSFMQQNAWIYLLNFDPDMRALGGYANDIPSGYPWDVDFRRIERSKNQWPNQWPEGWYKQNAQLWMGIYNPYNVRLDTSGSGTNTGPMIFGYPQAYVNFFDSSSKAPMSADHDVHNTFMNERYIWANQNTIIEPGSSQLFGFADNNTVSNTRWNRSSFTNNIKNASGFSTYRWKGIENGPSPTPDPSTGLSIPVSEDDIDFLVEFGFVAGGFDSSTDQRGYGPNMAWGVPYYDNNNATNTASGYDMAQVFYLPFSDVTLDNKNGLPNLPDKSKLKRDLELNGVATPGAQVYREGIRITAGTRMQPDEEAIIQFKLRTTRESGAKTVRPLIDGNIRAIWNNPKWDTGLDLNALATYTFTDNNDSTIPPTPLGDTSLAPGNQVWLPTGNGELNTSQTILFDIPRDPLVSLGQLQHAAAGRFSYEPTYIVGNSYANIRIPLNSWVNTSATDTYSDRHNGLWEIDNTFRLYDASYLVNEALFDGYTFSTIPQASSNQDLTDFFDSSEQLRNPRYIPYLPADFADDRDKLREILANDISGRSNAAFILTDGAFNVNSTSVEAWKVFLSGTQGLPVRKLNSDTGTVGGIEDVPNVRFPRVQTILGEHWTKSPGNDSWFGFRNLLPDEIEELAQGIVEEIEKRGPFYNLSEFINRKLEDSDEGRAGILQTVLDEVVNIGLNERDASGFSQLNDNATQAAGFPIHLLQGDILQSLAPFMQTRSDTFRIRSYGEATDPVTGEITGRAWCEAVVQRLPDPVATWQKGDLLDEALLIEFEAPTSPFGRQFRVISFRWLDSDEV